MKKRLLFLTAAFVLLCAFSVSGGGNQEAETQQSEEGPKVVNVRINADIKNLDPARRYTQWDDVVAKTLFSGLVRYSANSYEIENDLAEEFSISDDGSEIYFKLHEGAQFHDGHGEVTAEDVKYSYERFLDDETGSVYADDWASLDHVEVTGRYEGIIHLNKPFAPLMKTTLPLNSGSIVPKDYVEEVGLSNFTTDVIGSGPYYLAEWSPNQEVVVKKNPNYFGEEPYWDEMHFKVIKDHQSAEIALQAGEIQFGQVSENTVNMFMDDPDFKVTDNPNLDYSWIGLNVENPKLEDVNVRKAIRAAVNVPDILEVAYNGQVELETSLIAPGLIGYWEDAPRHEQDIELAKEYMEKAGVDELELTMDIVDESEFRAWAQILQENLKKINIDLQINPLEYGTYWEIGVGDKGKELQLFSARFQMQPDPSWATMWFTSEQVGVWNWMRWASEEFDTLHRQGLTEMDESKRDEIYVRMQQLMDEDAVAIWITHGKTFYAYDPEAVSPAMTPHNALQFRFFGPGVN
ncbi:MAG: ABC transporter substrate-binding protein [Spirochaetota bacterium]